MILKKVRTKRRNWYQTYQIKISLKKSDIKIVYDIFITFIILLLVLQFDRKKLVCIVRRIRVGLATENKVNEVR